MQRKSKCNQIATNNMHIHYNLTIIIISLEFQRTKISMIIEYLIIFVPAGWKYDTVLKSGLAARKPVLGIPDHVRLNPACSATETY